MSAPRGARPVAEVLAIGDELVFGSALDTNSKWLGRRLENAGFDVTQFTVVNDRPADLLRAFSGAVERADLVIASGGLGPTEDDRTRDAFAQVAGVPLQEDAGTVTALHALAAKMRRSLPSSNLRQALFPRGAEVLPNSCGSAPGIWMSIGDARAAATPGVPHEMRAMYDEVVLPRILRDFSDRLQPAASRVLQVMGWSEAHLGEVLAEFMDPNANPRVGITASFGALTIRVLGSAPQRDEAEALCAEVIDRMRPLVAEVLLSEDDTGLAHQVVARLRAGGHTVTAAESCTGGRLLAALTEVSGVSAVLEVGYITYSDAAKSRDLGVDAGLLAAHGAVSEPVAAAMAEGARKRAGSDFAVSITGIAGPNGGTEEKPVGMVCFGLVGPGLARTWTLKTVPLSRGFIQERSVQEALAALLQALA